MLVFLFAGISRYNLCNYESHQKLRRGLRLSSQQKGVGKTKRINKTKRPWQMRKDVAAFADGLCETVWHDFTRSRYELCSSKPNCQLSKIMSLHLYFETKVFDLFGNKIYKIPPPPNPALNEIFERVSRVHSTWPQMPHTA